MGKATNLSDPIQLDFPIARGDTSIESLQLRRPQSGELRGLSLVDIVKLETDTLHELLPRITVPTITEPEAVKLEAPDLFALATALANFFVQNGATSPSRDP